MNDISSLAGLRAGGRPARHGEHSDDAPMTLHFISGTFHPGLNVTVRRGLEWFQKGLLPGQTITLCVCPQGHDHSVIGQARVAFVMAAQIESIPDELMAYEHEPSCRSKEGLLQAMSRVFGKVRADETVTVIGFEME